VAVICAPTDDTQSVTAARMRLHEGNASSYRPSGSVRLTAGKSDTASNLNGGECTSDRAQRGGRYRPTWEISFVSYGTDKRGMHRRTSLPVSRGAPARRPRRRRFSRNRLGAFLD